MRVLIVLLQVVVIGMLGVSLAWALQHVRRHDQLEDLTKRHLTKHDELQDDLDNALVVLAQKGRGASS